MAAMLASVDLSCWQCSQPAQRTKGNVGACFRHCLPTRKEHRALTAGAPVPAPRPTLTIVPKQAKPAKQPKQAASATSRDGIVWTRTEMRPATCEQGCREDEDLGHIHRLEAYPATVTYYGGGPEVKRILPKGQTYGGHGGHDLGGGHDLMAEAYKRRGRKIDYRQPGS